MPIEIKVPEIGESITEVQIAQWLKAEGDVVEKGEPLVVIDSEKTTVELPAPESGALGKILHQAGATVQVGEAIAQLESSASRAAPGRVKKGAKSPEKPTAKPTDQTKAPDGNQSAAAAVVETDSENAAGKLEAPAKPQTRSRPPRGRGQDSDKPAVDDASQGDDETSDATSAGRSRAKDGAAPKGEGGDEGEGGGRIRNENEGERENENEKEDEDEDENEDEGEGGGGGENENEGEAEKKKKTGSARASKEPAAKASAGPDEEIVPMSMLRRTVARRLVEAKQQMAMLTTFNETDMSAVQALRHEYQESFEKRHQVKLGLMSFFVKAAVDALKQFPQLNAEVRGNDIVYRNTFNIGVAIATGRGLVVPVLRHAERLSFADVEKAISEFAGRAKDGKLKPDELAGATFTITNGGVFGSLLSTPIINPPQSGILGLHSIQERPVALRGQVVVRPMMYVALTYDHRIVDGREAVLFTRRIKDVIENPARMLIET